MKKTIYTLSIILLQSIAMGQTPQCTDCNEIKDISTNPSNPKNCEVDAAFPTKTNQLLNTFDWGAHSTAFAAIGLNQQAGWDNAPNSGFYSVGSFLLHSPFSYGYLNRPGKTADEHDWHWEDGWELMYLGTGYYPNGDILHDPSLNTNPAWLTQQTVLSTNVPYFVLYNRYTGKMRIIANLYAVNGTYDDAKISIGYHNKISSTDVVSGIFRHINNYDTPLDRKTTGKYISTYHKDESNDKNKWMQYKNK